MDRARQSDVAAAACGAEAPTATAVTATDIPRDINFFALWGGCGAWVVATDTTGERALVPDEVGVRMIVAELRHVRAASKCSSDGELRLLMGLEVHAISIGIQIRTLDVELAEATAELASLLNL
jgi:hypothetical protein